MSDLKKRISDFRNEVLSKQDKIEDLPVIRSGASKGETALQKVPETYRTSEDQDKIDLTKQPLIDDLSQIRDGASKGKTAIQNESDPTVPKWAKAPNKPSYTAEEVGALSKDTVIPVVPTKVSAFENDSGFITKIVSDLINYYAKSETYTKAEVLELIDKIPKFSYKVVDELPTSEISASTIYLVRDGGEKGNVFTEYIYVDNDWEILGSQKIDLDGYATEDWVKAQGYLTEHQDVSMFVKTTDAMPGDPLKVNADTLGRHEPEYFAKQSDVGELKETKANKRTIKTTMDSVATINTDYFLGEKSSVNITLPSTGLTAGDMIAVVFYSGSTPATLSVSGTMLDFDYVPSANSRSEINALWDGTYWTLLSNEQAVTA